MWQRCTNRKSQDYPAYGGRGIAVCDRWRAFENFLADMGEASPGLTIDRKDGSLGYEPMNCRWATATEQSRNRPGFVKLTPELAADIRGERFAGMGHRPVARELGVSTRLVQMVRAGSIWKADATSAPRITNV